MIIEYLLRHSAGQPDEEYILKSDSQFFAKIEIVLA